MRKVKEKVKVESDVHDGFSKSLAETGQEENWLWLYWDLESNWFFKETTKGC